MRLHLVLVASVSISLAGYAQGVVAGAPVDAADHDAASRDPHPLHDVRLGVSLDHAGRDTYDTFNGSGQIGFGERFGSSFELGLLLRGHYQWTNRPGDLATGDLNYLLVPKIRFRDAHAVVPYVGAQLGLTTTWYSQDNGPVGPSGRTYRRAIANTLSGGGVVGLDIFLDRSTSLFAEVSSLYTVVDSDLVRANDLVLGLAYWF
ncbi:MAG: outer membrane beta-barrel protein [Planctomycetes bacterium]|nr:outer membrane beta-barrel protein [Planctomycetota bacterium]